MAAWTHKSNVSKLGYFPLQLVTGKAVNIPGLTIGDEATDSLFYLESVKKIMERHFTILREFSCEEYAGKISQALKTPRHGDIKTSDTRKGT